MSEDQIDVKFESLEESFWKKELADSTYKLQEAQKAVIGLTAWTKMCKEELEKCTSTLSEEE